MNTGLKVFSIVVLGVSFFILIYASVFYLIKRLRRAAIADLRRDVGEEKVYQVCDCSFIGIASSGYAQMRGNGVLALTGEGLHFRMLSPKRYLFIPLRSVREVSHPRSFMGNSKFRRLLRVDFFNQEGEKDAAAWLVPDYEWWGKAILNMRGGMEPPPRP